MMLGTILNLGSHRDTDPDSWYFSHFSLMVTDGCWSGQMRSAMYDALAQLLCHRQCGRTAGCEVSVFSTSAYTMASLCLLCPPLLSPLWPKRVGACPCQCLLTADHLVRPVGVVLLLWKKALWMWQNASFERILEKHHCLIMFVTFVLKTV